MGKAYLSKLDRSNNVVPHVSVVGCRTRRQLRAVEFNSYKQVRFVLDEDCRPNMLKVWNYGHSCLSSEPCCTTFQHTCNKIFRTKSKKVMINNVPLTCETSETELGYYITLLSQPHILQLIDAVSLAYYQTPDDKFYRFASFSLKLLRQEIVTPFR